MENNKVEQLGIMIADNPELDLCLNYLRLRDTKEHGAKLTKKEIAAQMGMSETTLWRHMQKWYVDGTWDIAREHYLIPKGMELATAMYSFIDAVPELMEKMIQGAKDGSPAFTLEVMKWAWPNLVNPAMASPKKPSPEELDYVNSEQDFDPTSV